MGSADADVVHFAGDARGDAAGLIDVVASHAGGVVTVAGFGRRGGFRQGEVAGCRRRVVRQRSVGPVMVVFLGELICWNLSTCLGFAVRGGAVLVHDVPGAQLGFERVAAASASSAGVLHGEHHAVVVQRRGRASVSLRGGAEGGDDDRGWSRRGER